MKRNDEDGEWRLMVFSATSCMTTSVMCQLDQLQNGPAGSAVSAGSTAVAAGIAHSAVLSGSPRFGKSHIDGWASRLGSVGQ